jgi:hypothetical protein
MENGIIYEIARSVAGTPAIDMSIIIQEVFDTHINPLSDLTFSQYSLLQLPVLG